MDKKRLNRFRVLIALIIILLVYPTSIFGRYVYNVANDMYLTSRKFYFESNLLGVNTTSLSDNNWNGEGIHSITYQLYSLKNNLERLDYDLDYTITYTTTSDKFECSVNSGFTATTKTGTIDADDEISPNVVTEILYVKTKSNVTIEDGESFEVLVTAKATGEGSDGAKYTKTLKGKYTITVSVESDPDYIITDKVGDSYALLTIKNKRAEITTITLNADPNVVRIDTNNDYYKSAKNDVNLVNSNVINVLVRNSTFIENDTILVTNNTIVDSEYVSRVSFKMGAEESTVIKLYKYDVNQNYSNLGDNSNSVVTVLFNE